MGLQAATSNKRKYEMNASCDDVAQDVQTNCTPSKNGRWSPPATNGEISNLSDSIQSSTAPAETSALATTTTTAAASPSATATVTSGAVTLTTATSVEQPAVEATNSSSSNVLISENSIAKLEAVTVPGETWNGIEPIVDSISKLQAVAVPGESWTGENTRSALATTLLTSEELDDDDDEFEDDFEDDETLLSTYSPIRYPCSPSRSYPAYPKPGYFPESYHQQNCSRTSQNNGPPNPTPPHPQPQYPARPGTPPTPVLYNGWNGTTGGGGGQNFYSPSPLPPPSLEHHPASQLHHPHYLNQQQTIRCAENGKSYFELGSTNYCNQNFITRHIKRCCDGRNNWCNNKQCYKERRMKMMNLSMFKLSRFRQSADQSLYRSVLICNTLKYIEKEIDKENKEFRQQHLGNCGNSNCSINQQHMMSPPPPQQQQQQQQQQHQQQHGGCDYGVTAQKAPTPAPIILNQQIYNSDSSNMNTNSHTNNNTSSLSAGNCNNSNTQSYSQTYNNNNNNSTNGTPPTTSTPPPPIKEKGPCLLPLPLPPPPTLSSDQPSYDLRHPLKDPQFGRATPFPVTTYMDTDSGYGGDDADDDCTRSINWGSVLSLSSQSALDPLNNNDLFSTPTPTATTTTGAPTCPPTSNLRNIPLSSSNDGVSLNNGNTSDSNTPTVTSLSNVVANSKEATSTSVDLITLKSSNSPSATLTTLLTTATTSISITPTSLTSPTSVSSLTPTHWNFDYLDMDLGGTTHEIYDILPNCYKFTTFTTEDFVKSTIMEPTKVVGECDTLDTFTTHIMVGS